MTLFGLCIYTFVIVSNFLPTAQPGIAIGVAGLLMDGKPVRMPTPFRLYLVFLLWALISAFASPFIEVALGEVIERFKLLVVMLLVLNALHTEGQLRFYLMLILVCFILFPARGTFMGGNNLAGRVVWTGSYSNPNSLAALSFLAFGVALAIGFSEAASTLVRLGSAISAVILLVVILRTQSRGVFLGVLVAMAPAFISMLLKQLRLAIGVGIVIAIVISFAIPPKTWDRLTMTKTEVSESDNHSVNEAASSTGQRIEILKTGWHIFLDHPIFGIGLGAYPLACNMYAPELGKRDTHNTYLNLAAELGLPGLLIWCWLIASTLLHASSTRRRAKESLLKVQQYWIERVIFGFLVSSFFSSDSGLNLLYIMLSVLWCSTELLANSSSSQLRHTDAGRT